MQLSPLSAYPFYVSGKAFLLIGLTGGCGYSDEELAAAYRDGHRSGIIWCKRLGEPPIPDIDEELLVRWREGFIESTSIQCASSAAQLNL